MTNDSFLVTFRTIAPEFAETSDATVLANLTIYQDFVSESYFGKFYERAVAFFVAHQMTLANIVTDDGPDGSYFNSGNVTMEKEGDLQRQYSSTSSTDSDDLLSKTYYGKMYLQLKRMCAPLGLTRIR
ncbi:DUF4054 domain-containing protein [Pectinatus frisingensis]|uniref:DUF4054 domain-containing protein n=1 Tax=Pectinatus frisingensis TaxID=865 RepID=UPI0018C516B4|nr:DUF4054 domain-containing protein [Pectinatus frisingensis]